ncbi:MAG: hypothetical protein U1F45_20410 [Burkholderiales bacterium]
MQHELIGPLWGNVVIVALAGLVTVACFVVMFRLLLRPGETDRRHPKHDILRDDH